MKFLALISMLIALYLLYRIAYPKQADTKKGDDVLKRETKPTGNVMGKSRFVLPDRSQHLQTPATEQETAKSEEKAVTFADETDEPKSVVVPPEELDEVFSEDGNSDENDIDFEAEEAEELNRTLGLETMYAEGIDYDGLQAVAKIVNEQPETVSEETGRMLAALEDTNLLEGLVSGNEGKMSWIKTVIDRYLPNPTPETESKEMNTDYDDFDVVDYLS
jgi:hypothetical protein